MTHRVVTTSPVRSATRVADAIGYPATDMEISVTGWAGTLFSYRTDMRHRGSRMTASRSARFTLLAHHDMWGSRWTGRTAWAARSLSADWGELIERATSRAGARASTRPPSTGVR